MNIVIETLIEWLQYKPPLPIGQWVPKNIVLPREVTSMPGPLRPISYQKAFYDAIDDPAIEVIVLKTSSQVGKSEFLTSVACNFIVADPAKILFVFPKDEAAEEFKEERLKPILKASTSLKTALRGYLDMRGHDKLGYLDFPGGFIDFKGGGSPTNLAGKPIRILLMDEIDRFEGSVGGEGDGVNLAMKRTATEHSRKIILSSTPKDKKRSRIDRLFDQTDKREYFVKCPNCKVEQTMSFDLDKGTIVRVSKRGTCYVCENCAEFWDQDTVHRLVREGTWKATSEVCRRGWVGFHISELYSPFSSLEKVMEQWEAAEGDPLEEQTFTNTVLGVAWEGLLFARKSPALLQQRREPINPLALPSGIGCLTCGVDVQGDRVEVYHWGWGIDEERWMIEAVQLYGDILSPMLWARVTEQLQRSFVLENGVTILPEAACIDAGYKPQTVSEYCTGAQNARLNFYATVGRRGEKRPLWTKIKAPQLGKLYAIGVDEGKTDLYMALTKEYPGPGYVHISNTITDNQIEQLVAETVTEKVNTHGISERVWDLPKRHRNEALDCAVLAHAAFKSLGIDIANRLEMLYGPAISQTDVGEIARSFG